MEDARRCADSNCHKKDTRSAYKQDGSKLPGAEQQSLYNKSDKPIPDNSPFFTERSNVLSSKGN